MALTLEEEKKKNQKTLTTPSPVFEGDGVTNYEGRPVAKVMGQPGIGTYELGANNVINAPTNMKPSFPSVSIDRSRVNWFDPAGTTKPIGNIQPKTFTESPSVGAPENMPVYTNTKKSLLTDEQNNAIINKNQQDTSNTWDSTIKNLRSMNLADTVERATNSPTRANMRAGVLAQKTLDDMTSKGKEMTDWQLFQQNPDVYTTFKQVGNKPLPEPKVTGHINDQGNYIDEQGKDTGIKAGAVSKSLTQPAVKESAVKNSMQFIDTQLAVAAGLDLSDPELKGGIKNYTGPEAKEIADFRINAIEKLRAGEDMNEIMAGVPDFKAIIDSEIEAQDYKDKKEAYDNKSTVGQWFSTEPTPPAGYKQMTEPAAKAPVQAGQKDIAGVRQYITGMKTPEEVKSYIQKLKAAMWSKEEIVQAAKGTQWE